jgi:singapore isolate B (sub-type 7) whole genome shotgun sequence assembly, scaffold_5
MIGFNSPEYYFSLQGTWMAGCVTAGIYTTNSPEACEYVLAHSESRVCVCQSGKSAMKILSIRDNLPLLKAIVIYWPEDEMPEVEDKEGVNLIFSHDP